MEKFDDEKQPPPPPPPPLSPEEKITYRDQLREARYSALADAEGFGEVCWAIEALGFRLTGKSVGLEHYRPKLKNLLDSSVHVESDGVFSCFDSLFRRVREARNDAFHVGVYARHATSAAIELALYLEEALMKNDASTAADHLVKDFVKCETWHLIAQARAAMLKNSFSYLPVYLDGKWALLSDLAIAKYLFGQTSKVRNSRLSQSIANAAKQLELIWIESEQLLNPKTDLTELLAGDLLVGDQDSPARPWLWLVVDEKDSTKLLGVLSPFELL